MKQLIPMDEHGMFADYNDTALVDSRFVADAFERGTEKFFAASTRFSLKIPATVPNLIGAILHRLATPMCAAESSAVMP